MKSLYEKPIINGKVRMTQPSLIFIDNAPVISEHIVTEDEICRIDLISLKHYSDDSYVDFILKYNGISNPFSINVGDVLLIPSNESTTIKITPFKSINNDNDILSIRDQFINTKRLSKKDAKRSEYLQRKAALKPNGSAEILPPNIRKSTDPPNITIGNGRIII
jgi:hypothetical protein